MNYCESFNPNLILTFYDNGLSIKRRNFDLTLVHSSCIEALYYSAVDSIVSVTLLSVL